MKSGLLALLLLAHLLLPLSSQASDGKIESKYLHLLRDLVDTNSDTNNRQGLEQIRSLLITAFGELGMEVKTYPLSVPGHSVLSFEVPNSQPSILLLGHIDTVFDKSKSHQTMRVDADRIYGPGVIDMKGGIVLMLNSLAQLKEKGQLSRVRAVINDDEEIGSPYSKSVLKQLAKEVKYGLVFEPGLPDGSVVNEQAGVKWLKLATRGKAAHAGLEPEKGIDACLALASKIVKLSALAQPEKGLLINPGVIKGGTKPNVVCEEASATMDVRFRSKADWSAIHTQIRDIARSNEQLNPILGYGPIAEVTELAYLPPLTTKNTESLLKAAVSAGNKIGQKINAQPVGYGSDANHLTETGIQLLVGLGPYGGGMHSEQEFMLASSYSERLQFVTELISQLINQQ